LVDRGSVQESTGLDPEAEYKVERQRRIASVLSGERKLALGILSFLQGRGPTMVDALIEQGDRRTIFETLFDLYDAELLCRDGARVYVSKMGDRLLTRAGIVQES